MKFSGDVPQDVKDLAAGLEQAEFMVESDNILPKERKAQIYTCLAHDWFEMDMEEEGNRLLLKANKVFPGYFRTSVIEHIKEDQDFKLLIDNITVMLLRRMAERT